MPFGTSCSKNLPGSRGTSHNQHIAHPPQPPIPPPARPEENRSHSKRSTSASRGPTRSRHHFGLTLDRLQPAPPQTRQLRRSRPDRCQTFQRTHLPRASPSTALQTGGPWNRSRGPIQPRACPLPWTSGSRQNTLRSFSAPLISHNGFRLSMVGPARCSCLPLLRSQSALGRNRHALQPGCRSTTPQRCPVANPSSPSGLPPCALRAPVAWTSARVCFCCCAPPSSIR